MTKFSISKKDEKYINNLRSDNQQVVIEAIEEIREEGSSALLPFLIDLLLFSNDEDIKRAVYNLLCELKQTDSIPVLMEAILNEKYTGIQEILIRTCWENGLDFTPYLSTFVRIVIHGDFMNAFEAFTVIENMEGTLPKELVEEMVALIEVSAPKSSIEKKTLLVDLLRIIPAIK